MAFTAFFASCMILSKFVLSVATWNMVASEVERIKFLFSVKEREFDESYPSMEGMRQKLTERLSLSTSPAFSCKANTGEDLAL